MAKNRNKTVKNLTKRQYELLKNLKITKKLDKQHPKEDSTKPKLSNNDNRPISIIKMSKRKKQNSTQKPMKKDNFIFEKRHSLTRIRSLKGDDAKNSLNLPKRSLTPGINYNHNKLVLDTSLFEILENDGHSISNSEKLPCGSSLSVDDRIEEKSISRKFKIFSRPKKSAPSKKCSPSKKYQIFKKMLKKKKTKKADSVSSSLADMFKKQRERLKFKSSGKLSLRRAKSQSRRKKRMTLRYKKNFLRKSLKTKGPSLPIQSKFHLTDSDSVSQCNFVSSSRERRRNIMRRMVEQREEMKSSIFKIDEISKNKNLLSQRLSTENPLKKTKFHSFVTRRRDNPIRKLMIKPKRKDVLGE